MKTRSNLLISLLSKLDAQLSTMKFRLVALAFSSAFDLSSASAVTKFQGWGEDEYYGKAVFLKFTKAGHCTKNDLVWEELAKSFADNEDFVFAELECDDSNELCDAHNLDSYPTYKYGDPDYSMGTYEGPMDLESLKKFTSENLPLRCSFYALKWCNAKELALIENLREMTVAERRSQIEIMTNALIKSIEPKLIHLNKKLRAAKKIELDAEEKLEEAEEEGELAKIKTAEDELKVAEDAVTFHEDRKDYEEYALHMEGPLEISLMEGIEDEIRIEKQRIAHQGVTFHT